MTDNHTIRRRRNDQLHPWSRSFAIRIAAATSTLIILACTVLSIILVRRDLGAIHRSLIERANTISELLVRESELSVLSGNAVALQKLGAMALEQPDVAYCRFFDANGHILATVGTPPNAASDTPLDNPTEPIEISGAIWEFQEPIYITPLRAREELVLDTGGSQQPTVRRQRIGTVGIGVALGPLFELRRTAFLTTGFFALLVALLASASALILARTFTRPLQVLASAADTVAGGDLSITVPVETQDEVASVARSFNAMVASLSESRAKLEDYSHTLEVRSKRLETLNQELAEASRMRSEFLAQVSHELRTPLHVIIGYAQMLAEGAAGQITTDQRDLLDAIERYSKLQLDLVTNVLDFSRLASGRVSFHVERFALWSLLADILQLQQSTLHRPQLRITLDVAPDIVEMETDRIKLQEVVRNLIDNAVKFTAEGTVDVRARRGTDDGRVIIEVNDTGAGIASEDLDRVFDEFLQLGPSSTRTTHGVGLGLSIVKQLVTALGGTVSVASSLGSGSTFTVDIPSRLPEDLHPSKV